MPKVRVRMSLLPEGASFEERVQDCFLTYRGAGLMLSPLDVQLVMEWADVGVPFEVVARGIRKAAERVMWDVRPGEPALRSLRACRRDVETEIKKWRARAVGQGTEPGVAGGGAAPKRSFEEERHHKAKAALAKLSRERAELAAICGHLVERVLVAPTTDLEECDRREELICAVLLRALPWEERRRLYAESAALVGDARLSTPHGRKLSRRFHQHVLLRRAIGLPTFW